MSHSDTLTNPLSKLKDLATLRALVAEARREGRTVVFANGCFDIIHVGHIRYLREAKASGDILIVGINSDESIRALKGKGRPLQCAEERAEILASFEFVDYVLIFGESTVDRILLDLKPDLHAKGTDYTGDTVPERETVRSYGGRIAIVGDPKDHSSRDMIASILSKLRT